MAGARRLVGIGAVALVLSVAACGKDSKTSATPSASTTTSSAPGARAGGKMLNIWYVNILPSYPAWGASSKLFTANAAKYNYKATAVGPPKIDVAAMIGMMDQAIADHADGIITCDADPTTFKSEIDKAHAAGIIVVTIGCTDTISDYSIGTDNKAFGETAADIIAQKVGQDARVGIVSTDQTTPNQVALVQAFKARAAGKYPNLKVVDWQSGKGDTAIDAQKITAMVAANPKLNAIWCIEGTCPAAAQPGLQEAGKKPGQVFVVGVDDVNTTIAALQADWVSVTLNQCFFIAPTLAVQLIRATKEGHPNPRKSWDVAIDAITKDKLPYAGCPASAVPSIS